jgi:transcriptional regulator GlxA family with amidase domain
MTRKRVGIVVFANVEVLDFCGPFEVFSVTRLDEARRREEPSPFEVLLVAEQPGPVVATGGLRVLPDVTLETCPSTSSSCPAAGEPAPRSTTPGS